MSLKLFILFHLFFIELTVSNDLHTLEIISNPPLKGKVSTVIRRLEETLNLTCRVISPLNEVLPKYMLVWTLPRPVMHQNRDHQVNQVRGHNQLSLEVTRLQETDSGEYVCEAHRDGETPLVSTMRVNVKNSSTPCAMKLMCPDGRCIPYTWCCDPSNISCAETSPSCCHLILTKQLDPLLETDHQRYSDMGFLQTTIYAVVGSAMAFMFVVTILIVAICRIHLKRQLPPRCPNAGRVLTRPTHLQQLYDLDVCFNRPAALTDILVTYNINNGVQFVGRPVSPPPYSEVVSTPPREGPPPPYASLENIAEETEPLRTEEQA
ncbi:hypothetical protein B566_EDAN010303 [Ephemera danica]|nr:hypothetical protein B566_EDAN010303 [Ephemera danica]